MNPPILKSVPNEKLARIYEMFGTMEIGREIFLIARKVRALNNA